MQGHRESVSRDLGHKIGDTLYIVLNIDWSQMAAF